MLPMPFFLAIFEHLVYKDLLHNKIYIIHVYKHNGVLRKENTNNGLIYVQHQGS